MSGAYDIVVAAGVESMGRVPMGSSGIGRESMGVGFERRYPDGLVPQGISAELIAARWGLSRTQLDEFALRSHQKAAAATSAGNFAKELAVLPELSVDEAIRPDTTLDALAALRPAFRSDVYAERFPQIDWSITAGNSSPLSDGSAALMITTSEIAGPAGTAAAGPAPQLLRRRRRPADDAHRSHPGDAQGAAAQRPRHRRHRPVRGQRGLRAGGPGLGRRHRRRPGPRQRARRRHRARTSARGQRRPAA